MIRENGVWATSNIMRATRKMTNITWEYGNRQRQTLERNLLPIAYFRAITIYNQTAAYGTAQHESNRHHAALREVRSILSLQT